LGIGAVATVVGVVLIGVQSRKKRPSAHALVQPLPSGLAVRF
jgi:hypothetical protein